MIKVYTALNPDGTEFGHFISDKLAEKAMPKEGGLRVIEVYEESDYEEILRKRALHRLTSEERRVLGL